MINAEHSLMSAEEKCNNMRQEKDDRIAVLESRVQLLEVTILFVLHQVLDVPGKAAAEEQELLDSRDGLEELEEHQPVSGRASR